MVRNHFTTHLNYIWFDVQKEQNIMAKVHRYKLSSHVHQVFLMMILSIKVEHNMRRRITNRFIMVTKIWLRYVTVYQWFKNKGLSVFWLMLWLLLVVWDVVVVIFDLFLVKCMFLCCSYRRGSTTFGILEIEVKCMLRHERWQRWIDA